MDKRRRKELVYIYTRCARDLHYRKDMFEVAEVASIIASATEPTHPMDFWLATDIHTMQTIAAGTHAAIPSILENQP